MGSVNPEKLAEQAIKNIKEDRNKADFFISEILAEIQQGRTDHSRAGLTLAKHLETMQRSNEQLVKITSLFQRTQSDVFTGFSDQERDSLFDAIKESQKEEENRE